MITSLAHPPTLVAPKHKQDHGLATVAITPSQPRLAIDNPPKPLTPLQMGPKGSALSDYVGASPKQLAHIFVPLLTMGCGFVTG